MAKPNLAQTDDVPAGRFMRPVAAAAHIDRSPNYLAKLRSYGGGPRYRILGGRVLYDRKDLEEWVLTVPVITSTAQQKANHATGVPSNAHTGRPEPSKTRGRKNPVLRGEGVPK